MACGVMAGCWRVAAVACPPAAGRRGVHAMAARPGRLLAVARTAGGTVEGLASLEICAGAGGQALGLEQAGFAHEAVVELDPDACETLRLNRGAEWKIIEGDIHDQDGRGFGGLDLLAGGIPCPPFSIAGKQLGAGDDRDLFPSALRLVQSRRSTVLRRLIGLRIRPLPGPRNIDDLRRSQIFSLIGLPGILAGHQLVMDDKAVAVDAITVDRGGHDTADNGQARLKPLLAPFEFAFEMTAAFANAGCPDHALSPPNLRA